MIKSGEIVQIKDSAYDGLTGLTIYGNTRQNLWQNSSTKTVNGVTLKANDDGSVTLSGTASSEAYFWCNNTYILKPGGTYTFSMSSIPSCDFVFGIQFNGGSIGNYYVGKPSNITGASSRKKLTFTCPQYDTARFVTFVYNGATVSGTYRVMLREATAEEIQDLASMPVTIPEGGTEGIPQDYPMLLASGDDDFDWCPPGLNSVGDDGSVEVVMAGKNLLNTAFEEELTLDGVTYKFNCDGSIAVTGKCNGTVGNVTLQDRQKFFGGQYTASGLGYAKIVLVPYADSANLDWNRIIIFVDTSTVQNVSYGVYRVILYNGYSDGRAFNEIIYPQLELGSTYTSYEPPRFKQTAIDLQGHKLCSLPDGTRDELHVDGDGRVTLTKRCGYLESGESVEWGWNGENCYVKVIASEAYKDSALVVNDLVPYNDPTWNSEKYWAVVGNSGDLYVNAPHIGEDNVDGFKDFANGHTFIYPLATPQAIDLGTVDLPALRKLLGNNIWVADDTPATIDVDYNRYRSGCDGFKVDGKHNYWDMRACLASRDTGVPEKKLSTVTVPYMSGFYDLSKLYGAIAFESREVTYSMEFVEDTTEELQARKSAILQWLSMVHDADIFDDDFPGYHFHGSYSDASWEEDDSGLQGSLEVTFLCHPFLVADGETSVSISAGERTVTVEGQPVNAYAVCASGSATVKFRGVQQSVGTTPVRLSAQLQPGDNAVTVTGSAVTLSWNEERV